MEPALRKLLERLDKIAEIHPELLDTEVFESLADAIANAFIFQAPGYLVPKQFGMFTPTADALVHSAIAEFIFKAGGAPDSGSPRDRLDAFQDKSVISAAGSSYRRYFGHVDDRIYNEYLKLRERDEYFGFK